MSPLLCVCVCALRLKRGSRTVGAKNLKKYPKNAPSWITEGRFSDRPDSEHGNPLKPVRTRDDVGKNFGEFLLSWGVNFSTVYFLDFWRRYDVMTETINIEFHVT